ncbi:MAG: site-specific integrase [Candidatus Zixiibacteriota bacterium]
MKVNIKNEKIKRRYFHRMREAEGLAKATICKIEKSILLYEEFTSREDFGLFNPKRATTFKEWINARKYKRKPVSVTTIYHHIRNLKAFFTWLSGQTGFKSKISLDSISYLTLDRKTVRAATSPVLTRFPTLAYVRKLADSIEIRNPIHNRDRALISFLFLSGMRYSAICSLPLICFNRSTLEISQDPQKGVDTKFGKTILSRLLPFDNVLIGYVTSWYDYLERERGFLPKDPLFPQSKLEQKGDSIAFVSDDIVPAFWHSSNSIRTILQRHTYKAGLEYFKPHAFRHGAIHHAMKYCKNAEQIKALSQNFGHENIGTTLTTYGKLDWYSQSEIITKMSFKEDDDEETS